MVKLTTLSTLAELEHEMARAGRAKEEAALQEAVRALSRPARGFLTTGQAAEQLGVSIPTVKRWIERGTLDGGPVEGRWLVATESVERILRVRKLLRELDEEGNPTPEEIRDLYDRSRRARGSRGASIAES
jgi:excisionase family DNA binding protein